jgi:sialic acid synthase SpsE
MERCFEACGRSFGGGRVLVVAEIGTAHGGDMGKARELIAAAAESGADCAKFQCVFADEILHPNTGTVPLPGGNVRLYDRFVSLEEPASFYAALKAEAEGRGMLFLCTPFGLRSARLLRDIGARVMKVASPELNHLPLIAELASYGLPTILSSGVSTLADIERAILAFRGALPTNAAAGDACGLALLHCVTAYPAPEEDYNLRVLAALGTVFGLPVGVSDHSMDPVLVPALSVAAGGSLVEKHICLSRSSEGLDDPIALPPADFAAMVAAVRAAQVRPAAETIAELGERFGRAKVEAVLGDGSKRLAPSEAANYERTNRSVHALRDIDIGEPFTASNLALLRTEKLLRPGLEPAMLPRVLGRAARRRVPSGEGVEWADVGDLA